jgi:hypothetical protein
MRFLDASVGTTGLSVLSALPPFVFQNPMRAQAAGVFAFRLPVVSNAMPAVERHRRARRSFQSHPLVKRES